MNAHLRMNISEQSFIYMCIIGIDTHTYFVAHNQKFQNHWKNTCFCFIKSSMASIFNNISMDRYAYGMKFICKKWKEKVEEKMKSHQSSPEVISFALSNKKTTDEIWRWICIDFMNLWLMCMIPIKTGWKQWWRM